jgi:tight adherence protein B
MNSLSGTGLLAGVCGMTAAAGVLLVAAGLCRVPVEPALPGRRTRRPRSWRASWQRSWRGRPSGWRTGIARRRVLLAAAAAGLLGWASTGWVVAGAALGLAVWAAPRLRGAAPASRQLARLEALEAWTRRLADLLGSGAGGLEQAIGASVRTCPPPIAAEVTALARRLRVDGAEPGLRRFADDLADVGSPAAELVAAALILRVRRGGRGLRPVLEALAADVADLIRTRRAIDADRAKPRSNVRVLIAVTAAVLGVTVVFARDYLSPFGTAAGQVMLAVIGGVFASAIWLLARITRMSDTARFLPAAAPAAGAATADPATADPATAVTVTGSWWG